MNTDSEKFGADPESEPINVVPEYELAQGVLALSTRVHDKLSATDQPVVVEIAGGSASGKTSAVADRIRAQFGDEAIIISMDDYVRGLAYKKAEKEKGNVLNWDMPEIYDIPLLLQHLEQLKSGESVEKPIYSFKTGEREGAETVEPKKVIIIEGLFALNEALLSVGDVKAFVETGTHGRLVRRLFRDITRTSREPADILRYFAEVVEPMHERYIQSTKKNADIVIHNDYKPLEESERAGLNERQLKFVGSIKEEELKAAGAEPLKTSVQIDHYYDPKDRELVETGEIMRIRDEGEKKILTYKGPLVQSFSRERPKFEFEIDADTEAAFLGIYGDKSKTIKKERRLFSLDDVEFSLDKVAKVENGEDVDLGDFVEIRSTDKEANEEKVLEIIKKLGLDINQSIRQSYFEM